MSPELKLHLRDSLNKISKAGISVVGQKELPYGVQIKLKKKGFFCAVNLYHSQKKGSTVVGSGGDDNLLKDVLSILSGTPVVEKLLFRGRRTGTDEAGKGDYFGPLVAAAVSCEEKAAQELLRMGAGDSKRLSAGTVRELYEKITEMKGISYSVCSVSPVEYNSLFASFKARGMNSLDIQAMAHGKAIAGVLELIGNPGIIVIDRFCDMKRLKPWLPGNSFRIELMTKAEDKEPAVAAASIIARSVYLDEIAILSGICGIKLKPGAGENIDRIGRELVSAKGENILIRSAKLHFSNTVRITQGA